MRIRPSRSEQRVDLQMTPMIDVVFQLLAFFIVSFRVVAPEGDLFAKMPIEVSGGDVMPETFDVPVDVRLLADARGELAAIRFQDTSLNGMPDLQSRIAALAVDNANLQVNLVCDTNLRYEHTMAALTACSGKRRGHEVQPLARDVRILSPK